MSERLVFEFMLLIGGRLFTNLNHDGLELVRRLEVEHRDNEGSRLTCEVFDARGDEPFPVYNGTPDPLTDPEVEVILYGRWQGEGRVKMFSGLLSAKKANYPATSTTTFVAVHKARRLRMRGRVATHENITIAEAIKLKAAEEGIKVTFAPSVAGDGYLNEVTECVIQAGESHWPFIDHLLRDGGYVSNTVRDNEIVVRYDKSDGPVLNLARGDDKLIRFDIRAETKREHRASRRKGHSWEHKPGRHQHNEVGSDPSNARHVTPVPAALPKHKKGEHRAFFASASVEGIARRLEKTGREITITVRCEPWMRNEERINLTGFGPQIDAEWHTEGLVHRLAPAPARTEAACTRGR